MAVYDNYKNKITRMQDDLHDRLMIALQRKEKTAFIMGMLNKFFARHKLTNGAYDFNIKSLTAKEYQAILDDGKMTMTIIDEACK